VLLGAARVVSAVNHLLHHFGLLLFVHPPIVVEAQLQVIKWTRKTYTVALVLV